VGYLRLLLDEELGPLTALQRKCLESINTSTRKLKRLIDTLLDVSHLETGRLHVYQRAYDFSEVVERAIADTRDVFTDRGVEVLCESLDEPRPAEGDPDKLTRAVMHVLDNAAKFTPRGAAVGIAIRKREDLDNAAYELIVADSGPGITDEDQRRILEPFFQVDGTPTRAHGGVGLGLAFARHVSEALGGGIEIHSPPHVEVAGRQLPGSAVTLRVRTNPERESGPEA
jgi:signal transduction histidine kinase